MTTCLGKSSLFGLLCVSFVSVYQFVCVVLSHLILRAGSGGSIVDNTLDYRSRDLKLDPPLLRSCV